MELCQSLIGVLAHVRTNFPVFEARDRLGMTPLHWAIMRSPATVVTSLVEAGANVNAADYEGKTCLHYAVELASMSRQAGDSARTEYCDGLVRYLLDRGAQANSPDGAGATAVHYAAELTEVELVRPF